MKRHTLLIFLIACLTSGCSLPGPQQSVAKRTYLLQGAQEPGLAVETVSRSCLTLRISTPGSAPGFKTARIAYMKEPQRLDYFAYHEWVDTPARMISSTIEARLDHIGMFGAVVTGASDIRADYRLDSEVIRLLQDFSAGGSEVKLTIKVNLVDVANRSMLNSRSFSYTETSDGANPEAGVAAANRAAEHFLGELATFLSQSITHVDCLDQDR